MAPHSKAEKKACAERVMALQLSGVVPSAEKPSRNFHWKILGGLAALLLVPILINPMGFSYLFVHEFAGRIASSDVDFSTSPLQDDAYSYKDLLGHYETTPKKPYLMPGCLIYSTNGNNHKHIFRTNRSDHTFIQDAVKNPAVAQKRSKLDSRSIARTLNPFVDLAVAIGLGLLLYWRATLRTYIRHNELGLVVGTDKDFGPRTFKLIPWQCLKLARVRSGKKQPWLDIRFDHGSGHIGISWQELTSCVEPGDFINALRTFAPHAVHNCKFPSETSLSEVDNHTYTKLWFKYYSKSSDRQRVGTLAQGDGLCNGRFEIVSRLGSGGQGTAYVAVDHKDESTIVLKEYILPVHRGQQVMEQAAKRLKSESDILAKIDHPSIVKLLDEFTEDHRGYIAMEYIEGTSLKALVQKEGPQPEEMVRDIAIQICNILSYLHSLEPPIIHRDLTPDNLILQSNGLVKLVDFNVAHQLESAATATVVGKHAYIPPEQFRGKPTTQSDIYAFGGTLHYLLTGQEPEPLTVSRPRLVNEKVSEGMNSIVANCTAIDASKRWANVDELKEALSQTTSASKISLKIASEA